MVNLTAVNTVSSFDLVFRTCLARRSAASVLRDDALWLGVAVGMIRTVVMVMIMAGMVAMGVAHRRRRRLIEQLGEAELTEMIG
jgi:hypothetical protein